MRHAVVWALAVAAALATSALADERWPGGGGHHGKFWRRDKVRDRLRLTDDEVDKLEDILARNRRRLEDLEDDVKKKRSALDRLLTDDRPDEATILAQVDQIEHARATLGKAGVAMLLEMRRVLTPEQQRELAQLGGKQKPKADHGNDGREEEKD